MDENFEGENELLTLITKKEKHQSIIKEDQNF